MLEDVAGAVHARALAVPHAEDAIELGIRIHVDLLGAPHRGGGEIFVQASLEDDVVRCKMLLGFPERLVECAERRPAIAGDETGSVQTRGAIPFLLQHRQPYQRLRAADIDAATFQRVLVFEGNVL
ncbi:hypothetical protein D3C86_1590700 [compost metagenome]